MSTRGRMTSLMIVLLGAWAAWAIAGAKRPGAKAPSIEALVAASPLVVLGTVVEVETKGETSRVTIDVEHIGKGAASDRLIFRVPERRAPAPSNRVVAFLASQASDGSWVLADDAAGLAPEVGKDRGQFVVMRLSDGLSQDLCDEEVSTIGSFCAIPTAKFLEVAKLSPSQRPPPSGTYRVHSRSCAPCEMESWLRVVVPPGLKHCGGAPKRAADVQCVRGAQKKKEPFWFSDKPQGIDSALVRAVVSLDAGTFELWYDGSIEGGGDCAAVVIKTRCAALTVNPKAGGDDWLHCDKLGADREYLCDQTKNRVESLSAPNPLSQLRCSPEPDWRMRACVVGEAAGVDAGFTTIPTGSADVACTQRHFLWCSD